MAVKTCKGCPTEVANNPKQGCINQEISHHGLVLAHLEENGYHDSDFFALCWNPIRQTVDKVWYRQTASWTYHNSATIDAPEDVQAAVLAWYRQTWRDAELVRLQALEGKVAIGLAVRSLTTRGKNVGLTGIVKYLADDKYGNGKRAGVRIFGTETVAWIDVNRLEVTTPTEIDLNHLETRAQTKTLASLTSDYDFLMRHLATAVTA